MRVYNGQLQTLKIKPQNTSTKNPTGNSKVNKKTQVRAVSIKVELSITLECIFSSHLLSKPKSDSTCTEQVGFLSLKDKNIQNNIIKLQIAGKCREWDWIVRMVTVHQLPKYFRQSTSLLGPRLKWQDGFSFQRNENKRLCWRQKESPRSIYHKTAPYWYLIIRSSYMREKDVQETSSLENVMLTYITEAFETTVILPPSYTSWTFIIENSSIRHWR